MRNRAAREAETRRVAAVIDAAAYSQWQLDYPTAEAALYGLRSMQDTFPHQMSRNPRDASEAYVRYVAPPGVSLPTFTAWYIRALMG